MLPATLALLPPLAVALFVVANRRTRASAPLALTALCGMLMGATPPDETHHELGVSVARAHYPHACGGDSHTAAAGVHYRQIGPLAGQTDGTIDAAMTASSIDGRFVPQYRAGIGFDHRWIDGTGGVFGEAFDPKELLPGGVLRVGPEDVFSVEGRFGWERPAVYEARLLTVMVGPGLPALKPGWRKGRLLLGLSSLGTGGASALGGELDLPVADLTLGPSVLLADTGGHYWVAMNVRWTLIQNPRTTR